MSKSTPYELTGRTQQKSRTRAAMLAATRELLAEGATVTVEMAAERAAISRTTAYRYFPNQRALLLASYPGLDAQSLLDADAPSDAPARLELVTEAIGRQLLEREPEMRAMLRLSLEPAPAHRRPAAAHGTGDRLDRGCTGAAARRAARRRAAPARARHPRHPGHRASGVALRHRGTPARGRGRPHALLRAHAAPRGDGGRGARALRLRLGHAVAPQDIDRLRGDVAPPVERPGR